MNDIKPEFQSTIKMRKLHIFEPHRLEKISLEGLDDPNFLSKKRQVFVFTEVGKPVFTRYGDESAFSSLFASLTTVIQKFIYQTPKKDNVLKYIAKGKEGNVYFVEKEKFFYVCVSKKQNENRYLVKSMLMFLHMQIISLITGRVNVIMKSKVSYDPRGLLGGTDKSLLLSIKNSFNSPSIFLNAYPTLFMSKLTRARIQGMLFSLMDENLIASIVLTPVNILAINQSKGIELQATDLLLILHLIQGNMSLKNCENWVPICLPGISDEGYVYAYIQFYTANIGFH